MSQFNGRSMLLDNKRFSQFSQTVVLLQQEGFLMGIGFIATGNWTGH